MGSDDKFLFGHMGVKLYDENCGNIEKNAR